MIVWGSRLKQFFRQHVHLGVQPIAYDQVVFVIEHAQSL